MRHLLKMCVVIAMTAMMALGLAACTDQNVGDKETDKTPAASADKSTADNDDIIKVKLYYSDDQGMKLVAVTKTVRTGKDKYQSVMEALREGTPDDSLINLIPEKTKVRSVKVADGVAVVDFSGSLIKGLGGGSTSEELMVGSIVNTLTEFSEIKKVRFKVEGENIETISGHMDLSEPVTRMKELL